MRKFLLLLLITIMLIGCGTKASKSKSDYIEDLQEVKSELINVNVKAEKMLHLYSKMWSIRAKGELVTVDLVERETGVPASELSNYFEITIGYSDTIESTVDSITGEPSDVVRGLQKLYLDHGQFNELEVALSDVKTKVQSLNNPPDEYEKIFDKLLEMYSLTEEMAGLAMSPSGSLITFNQKINELSEDIVKLNNEIEVLLPSKDDMNNEDI